MEKNIFIIEKSNNKYSFIVHRTAEGNPYPNNPEFFEWKSKNRVDKGWESQSGNYGDCRFYLHSGSNNNDIRLFILFTENRIGNKEVLSETLDTECYKLLNKDYSNLEWWFELEQSLLKK